MSEVDDRIKRLETLLGELCAAIIDECGWASLGYEADRIRRELAVEYPPSCA